MCDCYSHKCELCDELIPMHIGDYKFPREDFRVWCKKHIPWAKEKAVIFEVIKNETEIDYDPEMPVGWKCAIWGPEVGDINDGDNSPNLCNEFKEHQA